MWNLQYALKLLLAAVLVASSAGARVPRQPAGLRTNILICLGSTLFMSISTRVLKFPRRRSHANLRRKLFRELDSSERAPFCIPWLPCSGLRRRQPLGCSGCGMALGSGMSQSRSSDGDGLVTLYIPCFIRRQDSGAQGLQLYVVVTHLNEALASINRVLQECSVSAVSFNFKKKSDITAFGSIHVLARRT